MSMRRHLQGPKRLTMRLLASYLGQVAASVACKQNSVIAGQSLVTSLGGGQGIESNYRALAISPALLTSV